ncbi:MAG TPA: hypothetical protein VFQ05_01785 [Candidatus Eisenbacteria bacterium]|nr:hypothetical protein [Candidatus Eisenbacteria bacterium]
MKKSSLRVLLQRGGELTIRGLPQALERKQGDAIRKQLPGSRNLGVWQVIGGRARAAVLEILDVDFIQVLVEGWGKYRTLAEFATEPKRSDGAKYMVSIADHSMSVTFHPEVVVTVEGVGRGTLKFNLEVKANIKAIILWIQNGRIMSASSGRCGGEVTLKLDDQQIVGQSFPEVDLPGVLEFPNGFNIPTLYSGAEAPEAEKLPV